MEKELPKNWVLTEVKVLSTLIRGVSYKKNDAKSTKEKGDFLILRGGNVQDGEIVDNEGEVYVNERFIKPNQKIKKGDVVIVGSTGSKKLIGKAGIAKKDYKNVSFGVFLMLIRPVKNINASFFDYYFLSDNYREKIRELAGGININNIRKEYIEELKFPLPSLPEQNRIVAKLDTLFEQLEVINTSLDKIPVLLKNFRQQVLTQAVTGKLTEEWRKGKNLAEWNATKLSDVIQEKPRNGFSPQGVDYQTAVKSMTLSATTSGKFNSRYVKYLDIETPKDDSHLWLKNGDILIQRSNSFEYVGTAVIYDGKDNEFIYPDLMMKIKANKEILNHFLIFSLNSSGSRNYFQENASGTAGNMPKINQTTVMNTPIAVPPLPEQQEIVNRVQSFFSKADAVERQYESLINKIENLPKSILTKAFKGELVPQMENDGDAWELLEEIEELKVKI